jgi:serine/threonine-protein kinase
MIEAAEKPSGGDELAIDSEDLEPVRAPAVDPTLQSRRDPASGPRPVESTPPSSRPALASGRLLGGRYRLLHKVGAGGMGEVWAAEHVGLHVRVAVKVLLPKALAVAEIVARFEREAILLGRLHSEYAPRALDFFADPTFGPVLVTELVDGESLADVIKTPMSLESAVELGIAVATAIGDIHRASVVHRDIKPSNVLLCRCPDGSRRAVILDLGVSRLVSEDLDGPEMADITTGDVVVGTIEYMAPEQILRCGAVTAGADLYALGALLFRAVTGGHLFGPGLDKLDTVRAKLTTDAPPLKTGRGDALSRGFAQVLSRALQRNPSARYETAEQLRADLEALRPIAVRPEVLDDEALETVSRRRPKATKPAAPATPATLAARRSHRRLLAAMTAALALIGGAVWGCANQADTVLAESGGSVDSTLQPGTATMTIPFPWTPNDPATPAPETPAPDTDPDPVGPQPQPIHRPIPEEPWRPPMPGEPPGPDPI